MISLTETTVAKKPRARKTPSTTAQAVEQIVEPTVEPIVEEQQNESLTVGVIAVDNGGDNVKVLSETMSEPVHFQSLKARGKIRDLSDPVLNPELHSHVVEWDGDIYLTNHRTSASRYKPMTSFKESKAIPFFTLSTLMAIAKYGYDVNLLVTCVPYANYKQKEVQAIKEALIREHTITIDHVIYNFEIEDVLVVIEAQAGHFYLKEEGITTLLEIGSRTVGYATSEYILDEEGNAKVEQAIHEKSGTLTRQGIQITNVTDEDFEAYTENIYSDISDIIDENDKIVAFGGGVLIEGVREGLAKEFKNITFAEEPLYVQVRGMLEMGKKQFNEEEIEEDDAE